MPTLEEQFNRWLEAMSRLSSIQTIDDEVRRLRKIILPSCGNCFNWMKTRLCPREGGIGSKQGGPSCADVPCGKFKENARVQGYRDEAEALAERACQIREEGVPKR